MPSLLLVNALDVGRAFGPQPDFATVDEVHDRLQRLYLDRPQGGFNHDPAIAASFRLFRGEMSTAEAVRYCFTTGNPKGRLQNAAIAKAVGPFAEANLSICHRIGFVAVVVGRYRGSSIHVGIKAPFLRVRHSNRLLEIPGFRKDSRPVGREIDVACSFAAAQLVRDDYEGADVEYLVAGPGEKKIDRHLQVLHGKDMRLFDRAGINELLPIYVEAVARHLDQGRGIGAARLAGYKVIDPLQPGML